METEHVDVIVIGAGTAGSNAARSAVEAGATKVIMVHPPELVNTCVEEGCMPSKSVLAGAHQGEPLATVLGTRNAHIDRLLGALLSDFETEKFEILVGSARFLDSKTVTVTTSAAEKHLAANSIIIATGSTPFVPPIEGLDTIGDRMLLSHHVVAKRAVFTSVPKRLLTIGGGPIGLELSTFFHDMGTVVDLFERNTSLSAFDPEFGEERVRASKDNASFTIHTHASLQKVRLEGDHVHCTIEQDGDVREEHYDAVLIATGRRPNIASLNLEAAGVELDERGKIMHDLATLQTSVPHILVAGDVTGHHQILHYAAEMGKVAGHNAVHQAALKTIDYDKHALAISFDQFPSAYIGLTQKEAEKRGIEVITASRYFNSIGLGILKRQEYGLWKLVAEKSSGKIIGSQIMGPDSAGELIQILVPIMHNNNTYDDILNMTWYHPTYAEILKSLARAMKKEAVSH